ncbi:MAG: DUF1080 domain-containing protein [Planctomycetia bacterium]|nr:DUF1080 domain-containing protein [Planctomycetia bacterium]
MLRLMLIAVAVSFSLLVCTQAADPKPIEPFNGKNLDGWKRKDEKKSNWVVGVPHVSTDEPKRMSVTRTPKDTYKALINFTTGGGCDIYTEEKFGDITLELEFMVPKGSNSGIYLMGEYEVQILDSFGKPDEKLGQGDLGALYSAAAPKKNASKKPGEWQKFVIEFQAPKFGADGKKTANAKFIKVTLNDVVLHENVEMKQQTPGGLTGKESATGPLMFQGDHGPVAFRNIKITPKK